MDNGWIRAHRTMLDHPLLQRADEIGLWVRLLLLATHRPQRIRFRGRIIALERGQAAIVMTDLVEPEGLSRKRLRLIVDSWVKDGMLTISSAKGQACSIVTICNFDTYQSDNDAEGPSSDLEILTNQSRAKVGPSSEPKLGQAKGQAPSPASDCDGEAFSADGDPGGQGLGQGRAKLGGDLGPTDQEDKKDTDTDSSLDSQANAHSVPSERADERPPVTSIQGGFKDAKAHLWSEMKDRIGGKKAGAVVGRWCATFGDGEVFAAHFDAVAKNPADYVSFMAALLKRRAEARAGTASRNGNRSLADQAASIMERLNGHGYDHEPASGFSGGDPGGAGEAPALDPPAPALVGR